MTKATCSLSRTVATAFGLRSSVPKETALQARGLAVHTTPPPYVLQSFGRLGRAPNTFFLSFVRVPTATAVRGPGLTGPDQPLPYVLQSFGRRQNNKLLLLLFV